MARMLDLLCKADKDQYEWSETGWTLKLTELSTLVLPGNPHMQLLMAYRRLSSEYQVSTEICKRKHEK